MTEIVEFIPEHASPEVWRSFHEYRWLRHQEAAPEDPYHPDQVEEAEMKIKSKMYEVHRLVVLDEGRVIGFAQARRHSPEAPDFDHQKDYAWIDVALLPEHRRKGLGMAALSQIAPILDGWGTRVVDFWTHEEAGQRFLDGLGAKEKYREAENRLDLKDVDWEMVKLWAEPAQGVDLEFYENRMPTDILDEYCPVYTEINNDMPREELEAGDEIFTPERFKDTYIWLDAIGGAHHTFIVRLETGEIAGLTDVMKIDGVPHFIQQWATGVLRQFRGRGLGKLVKAKMLEFIRERYPEVRWVTTENAGSNEPMLAINHKLGFKKLRDNIGYQLPVADLKRVIGS